MKGIGFLTDVPRLFKLSDVVSKGVKTDDTLQLKDLRGIANKLVIGEETVKSHSRSIYRKLGVSDRTGAVATALREGIYQ